ncbi:MAG: rRNA maturation RNase YbeY [Magnetococcales bacterium]|nr:rRNA maturation RNase YbeY [Magnetococcales bacterium]
MDLSVEIQQNQGDWPADAGHWITTAIQATLDHTNLFDRDDQDIEVSVLLTDDPGIQAYNADYRGMDKPTNVLSFAMEEGDDLPTDSVPIRFLGDLILSLDSCVRESDERAILFENHLIHLVVHGVLHLLGYDHERSEWEAERQESMERSVLAELNISDPYA